MMKNVLSYLTQGFLIPRVFCEKMLFVNTYEIGKGFVLREIGMRGDVVFPEFFLLFCFWGRGGDGGVDGNRNWVH